MTNHGRTLVSQATVAGGQVVLNTMDTGVVFALAVTPGTADFFGNSAFGNHPTNVVPDLTRLFNFTQGTLLAKAGLLEPIVLEYLRYRDLIGEGDSQFMTLNCFPESVALVRELLSLDLAPGQTWCAIAGALSAFSAKNYDLVLDLAQEFAVTRPLEGVPGLDWESPFSWYLPTWPVLGKLPKRLSREFVKLEETAAAIWGTDPGDKHPSLAPFTVEERRTLCSALDDCGTLYSWKPAALALALGDLPVSPPLRATLLRNLRQNDPAEVTRYLAQRLLGPGQAAVLAQNPKVTDCDLVQVATRVRELGRAMEFPQDEASREEMLRLVRHMGDTLAPCQHLFKLDWEPWAPEPLASRHLSVRDGFLFTSLVDAVNSRLARLGAQVNFLERASNSHAVWKAFLTLDLERFQAVLAELGEVGRVEGSLEFLSHPALVGLLERDERGVPLALQLHLEGVLGDQ